MSSSAVISNSIRIRSSGDIPCRSFSRFPFIAIPHNPPRHTNTYHTGLIVPRMVTGMADVEIRVGSLCTEFSIESSIWISSVVLP
jgi:hypothetical protein